MQDRRLLYQINFIYTWEILGTYGCLLRFRVVFILACEGCGDRVGFSSTWHVRSGK